MNATLHQDSLSLLRLYREKVLGESPQLIQSFDPKSLDDAGYNFKWTEKYGLNIKTIDNIQYIAKKLSVHEDTYDDKFEDYFIDTAPFTCARFTYKLYVSGIQFIDAWNHYSQGNGMCRWLIFNYYLKKQSYIISDVSHTPEGARYWNLLIFEGLSSGHKIVVLTPTGEVLISSAEQSEQYYNIQHPGKYLFKIYAK